MRVTVNSIPEAFSVCISDAACAMKHRGDRVITLFLGEAFFGATFFGFDEAMSRKGCHYSESRGITELREAIFQLMRLTAILLPEARSRLLGK